MSRNIHSLITLDFGIWNHVSLSLRAPKHLRRLPDLSLELSQSIHKMKELTKYSKILRKLEYVPHSNTTRQDKEMSHVFKKYSKSLQQLTIKEDSSKNLVLPYLHAVKTVSIVNNASTNVSISQGKGIALRHNYLKRCIASQKITELHLSSIDLKLSKFVVRMSCLHLLKLSTSLSNLHSILSHNESRLVAKGQALELDLSFANGNTLDKCFSDFGNNKPGKLHHENNGFSTKRLAIKNQISDANRNTNFSESFVANMKIIKEYEQLVNLQFLNLEFDLARIKPSLLVENLVLPKNIKGLKLKFSRTPLNKFNSGDFDLSKPFYQSLAFLQELKSFAVEISVDSYMAGVYAQPYKKNGLSLLKSLVGSISSSKLEDLEIVFPLKRLEDPNNELLLMILSKNTISLSLTLNLNENDLQKLNDCSIDLKYLRRARLNGSSVLLKKINTNTTKKLEEVIVKQEILENNRLMSIINKLADGQNLRKLFLSFSGEVEDEDQAEIYNAIRYASEKLTKVEELEWEVKQLPLNEIQLKELFSLVSWKRTLKKFELSTLSYKSKGFSDQVNCELYAY